MCNSQHLRMALQEWKHVVKHKLINYSSVDSELVLLFIFGVFDK
jgi:hypothetical protein